MSLADLVKTTPARNVPPKSAMKERARA